MGADHDINELLATLGYVGDEARLLARRVLDSEGLTNPKRSRVSAEKRARSKRVLRQRICVVCSSVRCQRALHQTSPERAQAVVTETSHCEHCGGSPNQRAMREFAEGCRRSGVTRVLLVGGAPGSREELRHLCPAWLELRLESGEANLNKSRVTAHVAWAQLILLCVATELDHKTSKLYRDRSADTRDKTVCIPKRGLAAILEEGAKWLKKRPREGAS